MITHTAVDIVDDARRTRTGALSLAPSCAAAPGDSAIRLLSLIGPRRSTRTRIVRPVVSEVTSA